MAQLAVFAPLATFLWITAASQANAQAPPPGAPSADDVGPQIALPPAAPEPVDLQPVGPTHIRAAAPVAAEPATPVPATPVPATTEPAAADPATPEPATPEPATTEPATPESAKPDPAPRDRSLRNVKIPPIGDVQPWARATVYGEWFGDNYDQRDQNDNFVALVSRLNFGVDTRLPKVRLSVQARVDTQNLFDVDRSTPLCDRNDDGLVSEVERNECVYGSDARLERFSARVEFWKLALTAGDFNVSFARGLGLTVRKIDEIGVDATVKGGRADLRFKPISFTLLAGLANRQNSDFATRQLLSDPGYRAARCKEGTGPLGTNSAGNPLWTNCADLVAGGRVQGKLPGKVLVGGHYTYVGFGEQLSQDVDETLHVAGADLARAQIAKHWDTFVGGAASFRNAGLRDDALLAPLAYSGYALYSANQINLGTRAHATSILLEGKFYRDYLLALTTTDLQYTGAPTLEREDQQVPGSSNAAGGRVRVDHTLGDKGLTVFGNFVSYAFAEGVQQDPFSKDEGFWMVHPYAGVLWHSKAHSGLGVQASGGYRYERHNEAVTPDDAAFRRKFPHAEFYVTVPVGDAGGFRHTVSVRGEARWETKQVAAPGDDNRFVFGNFVLGYAMAPRMSVSFIGGFSSEFPGLRNEPTLATKGCAIEANCLRKPHLWPGAEVRVNFMQNSFVRLFAGRQVGGRVCVNGSCRLLPDFEGVRAEVVLGF